MRASFNSASLLLPLMLRRFCSFDKWCNTYTCENNPRLTTVGVHTFHQAPLLRLLGGGLENVDSKTCAGGIGLAPEDAQGARTCGWARLWKGNARWSAWWQMYWGHQVSSGHKVGLHMDFDRHTSNCRKVPEETWKTRFWQPCQLPVGFGQFPGVIVSCNLKNYF